MRSFVFAFRGMRTVGARALFMGVLALSTLTACKRNESGQLPGVSGEAIQAKRQEITGFGLVTAYPKQRSGNRVDIALEFSRSLVSSQDFDELLVLTDDDDQPVEGSWSLDRFDDHILNFRGAEPAKDYQLTVRADLLATDGSQLGKEIKQRINTGDLNPLVGFASQGSILPARESRGLPVVSINVKEVDVEFFRVSEKSLPVFFANYKRGGRRDAWDMESDYSTDKPLLDMAEPVYLNRFVLGGKPNERLLTYLPIQNIKELQDPGLYFAVMKRTGQLSGSELETSFFTVSDLGLHTRAYRDQLFVHTASLRDGTAVGGTELRIINAKGETLLTGKTDSNGNALLKYTLDAAHVLIAQRGKDVSMLPFNQPALDLSEFAVSGQEQAPLDVFAWSGRDLYRPGETLRLSALLRDFDGRPVKAQPIFVRLKQPDGKTFRETRVQPGEQGYFNFEQTLGTDVQTGVWQVEFRTDPESKEAAASQRVLIEEFLPERMKLDLDSTQATLKPGEPLQVQAKASYLYGAPAGGNRFTARLVLAVDQHPVKSLPGYFFGDPTVDMPRSEDDIIDTQLDADGVHRQAIPLPEEVRPVTPVKLILAGSVHESGGRSVNRSLERVMWPASALVGVRPRFDDSEGADANARAGFEIMRVDAAGKPQPGKGLKATLVREHRDYHWNNTGNGWDYDFTRRFENLQTQVIDVGTSATRIDYPLEWGQYRLDVFDPATGLTTRYPFHAGWGWDDENRGLDARPDKVKLALDKTYYKAGDTVQVTLTPPHAGKGLLMVETDRMLYVQQIDAKPGSQFSIPVSKDWERHDVYITALVFRGGSVPSKITPARAVGVVHVPMDRRARRVAVGLVAPQQMRPEQDMPVTVSVPELAGKAAHVTVSAVDVGILNITNFPVPDANKHFFEPRRLGVDAYDIYGRVIESFEGETAKIRFGGDMAVLALTQARRPTAHVQTVDLFAGPVKLDAQGNARLRLKVPDFNGTLRVSALVYSDDRYGNRDRETVVRAPIVAEASLPRVLAPGDRSRLTLDVQNFTGKAGEFKVQVSTEGPLQIGDATRSATLAVEGKSTLSFPITATEGYTTAKVRVRVNGNGINIDRRYDLPVRAGWPAVLRSRTLLLDSLSPVTMDTGLADGLMSGSVNARMLVSALPPIPFASALKGALEYPYGCAEQTTSRGYATLELDEVTAKSLGVDGITAKQRRERMEATFARLASMQISNGHFSMWGGDDEANPILTPYIVEFLLDARAGGFAVPDGVLQKALNRLNEDLLSGGAQFYGYNAREHLKFAQQAYAGYVLARVNRAPLGTLRALYDNRRKESLTGLPLVHLGIALSLQGDKTRGEKAIAEGFTKNNDERLNYLGDYGTRIRDDALMVGLLHAHKLAKPEYDRRVVSLGQELDSRRQSGWLWLSTQEQVALARLAKGLMVDQKKLVSGRWSQGEQSQTIAPAKLFARTLDHAGLAQGAQFVPVGEPPLYVSLEVAGVPRTAPAIDGRQIGIVRNYYTVDGKPWNGSPLKEGQALIVRVSITPNVSMPDALLTDLLPAGLEIENFNLGDASQWADVVVDDVRMSDRGNQAHIRHEEFRDDRYVAALNLERGSTAQVFYLVRAVTPGTYTVPPSLVEDMYRPNIRGVGRTQVSAISVIQP